MAGILGREVTQAQMDAVFQPPHREGAVFQPIRRGALLRAPQVQGFLRMERDVPLFAAEDLPVTVSPRGVNRPTHVQGGRADDFG